MKMTQGGLRLRSVDGSVGGGGGGAEGGGAGNGNRGDDTGDHMDSFDHSGLVHVTTTEIEPISNMKQSIKLA